MDSWEGYVEGHACDEFLMDNKLAFHAYDYGANIEIKVNEVLQTLPRETRLRHDDEESESDSGDDEDTDGLTGNHQLEPSVNIGGERVTPDTSESIDYHGLYPEGLRQLRTEMEQKYVLITSSTYSTH
jgi:hypothetical protein